mmetsp:Transcript_23930/g.35131  ORF Transcript_23930/g.35131 Transcript_23930/m.35131 type:complete len:131 (-) Transcript_23930:43-435(-)
MEIISSNDGILCNAEVYDIIKEKRGQRPSCNNPELQNREVIENNLMSYVETQRQGTVSLDAVGPFIEALTKEGIVLTKAEVLLIINHLPTTPVEVHLIVEECDERLSEDQMQIILDSINKYLSNAEPSVE